MRPYEVMIIFDPTLDDERIQAGIERSTQLVSSRGGRLGQVDRWGKRRLAYELKHHREGYYVLVEADAEPPVMAELHRTLQLSDEVLRHKVIRIPDRVAGRSTTRSPAPSAENGASVGGAAPPQAAPTAGVAAPEAASETATSANGE